MNYLWQLIIKKVEQDIKEYRSMLKSTIGIVGENADDMIKNSKNT